MSHLFWYTARAAGIVAWGLLSASVIWGLWLSGRVRPFGARPAWILDLHRFLGGLATIFVGVHVAAILADSYTSFGPTDVLVPFASAWHPVAVAWGIVGMYLLLAVELTSLARRHLPNKFWRLTHLAALPLFVVSTIHYVSAGTDASNRISLAAIGAVCGTVAVLFARRMSEVRARGGVLPGPSPAVAAGPRSAEGAAEARVAALAARRAEAAARR
jgi:methionine sulfoxide reductase heme-binding subunit